MSLINGNLEVECERCNHTMKIMISSENSNSKTKGRNRNSKRDELPKTINDFSKFINFIKLNNNDDDELDLIINERSFPICIQVEHIGFWVTNNGKHESSIDKNCDKNSVMLSNSCLLYIYKLALRHLLLSMKIISPSKIDAQNLVPHIVVRKSKTDLQSHYDSIKGENFRINENSISIKSDFMLIELDEDRDLHMTMVYCKKIKDLINLKDAFSFIIKLLNKYPFLINEYSKLEYFGEDQINYWYDTPNSFPFHIKKPVYYKKDNNKNNFSNLNVSLAGSILNDD